MEKVQQQAVPEGDVVMKEAGEGVGGGTDEVRVGTKCSRCSKKGHATVNCTAEIYCVICDKHDHVNYKCPILKTPRPVAHAVGYVVHGLGFYHIPRPPLARSKREARTALISVEGGMLLMEEVQKQLERLFPGKWLWELRPHEGNTFLAKFPSKVDLQRAVAFGGADIKGLMFRQVRGSNLKSGMRRSLGFCCPRCGLGCLG
jgi:hypothetical protein